MSTSSKPHLQPVILAGGSGTRLWPLSRTQYPKQFLKLADEESLFSQTLSRVAFVNATAPLVVCNDDHRFLVAEELRRGGMDDGHILLEPEGRDTAPAIGLAALEAQAADPEAVLLVLPADHAIDDSAAFADAVNAAIEQTSTGRLVTFGIPPKTPETGYGYIRATSGEGPRPVQAFVEKPDRETAEDYLADGRYFWNSGMFVFRARDYLSALAEYAPIVYEHVKAAHAGRQADQTFVRVDATEFAKAPAISVDYAVMEHTEAAAMVPFSGGWRDVGSWTAVQELGRERGLDDAHGNVTAGDVVLHDSRGCLIHASDRLVGVAGLTDCVVAETADAVLVASLDRAQGIKAVVQQLEAADRREVSEHREVYRPWGSYTDLEEGERFRVKRIAVSPGACLSRQMHHHRAEHWVIVRGTARVENGGDRFLLAENQSTYIPVGTVHRLENPGTIPLELVEVQTGSYLGEDDIVRFEDTYGRTN